MTMQNHNTPDEPTEAGAPSSSIPQEDFIDETTNSQPQTEQAESPAPVEAPAAEPAPVVDELAEAVAVGTEEAVALRPLRTANRNVSVNDRYSEPHGKIHRVPRTAEITFPSITAVEMTAREGTYNINDLGTTEFGRKWLMQIAQGQTLMNNGNALYSSQYHADSEWVQRPEIDGESVGIAKPRYGDEKQGGLLTGERAVQRIRAAVGLGASLRVPLWHTGIWVSFKAPGDDDLLELNRLVESEKVTVGSITHGMLYANTSVVTNMQLVDFALSRIYQASLDYENVNSLKSQILIDDLPTLVWGLMCTIYPNGFPYTRPCVTGPTKCQHQVQENLLLTKLSWTNQRLLTEKQRAHMKKRTAKFTVADLKAYQSEHRFAVKRVLSLDHGVTVEFRTPTLADYESSGTGWIDGLKSSVDEAFGGRVTAEERNNLIINRAQTTAVRNYAHYIERLVLKNADADEDNKIEDRETLEETLSALSADATIHEAIIQGAGDYIEATTVSLIAIPRYNCPMCDHDQGVIPPEEGREAEVVNLKLHPELIPLDVTQLFFTLIDRHLSLALSKRLV